MVKLNHTITKIQFVAEVFFFFTLSNLFLTYKLYQPVCKCEVFNMRPHIP